MRPGPSRRKLYSHAITKNGSNDTMSMHYFQQHSYLPLSSVLQPVKQSPNASQLARFRAQLNIPSASSSSRPLSEVKRIVDRVHNHTCGHSTFSDMKSLLHRNNFWSPAVMKYLTEIITGAQTALLRLCLPRLDELPFHLSSAPSTKRYA